ncbi:MAG: ribbon-helix-helix domain-containing protein [Litorimonas sp.]
MMIKRSISIYGHSTSLALESEFWAVIDMAVTQSGLSFSAFIRGLDDKRMSEGGTQNLASYLRVWALNHVQNAIKPE